LNRGGETDNKGAVISDKGLINGELESSQVSGKEILELLVL